MTSPPGPTLDPRPNEDILLSASIQNLILKTLLVKRYLLALTALDNNKCSDSGEEEEERVDHETAANLAMYCSENPYIKRNE